MLLCCARYSLINILSALRLTLTKKSEKNEASKFIVEEEGNVNYLPNQIINDLHVVQNIIHVIKVNDF